MNRILNNNFTIILKVREFYTQFFQNVANGAIHFSIIQYFHQNAAKAAIRIGQVRIPYTLRRKPPLRHMGVIKVVFIESSAQNGENARLFSANYADKQGGRRR